MDAWHKGRLATRLELATRYTKDNPERVAGWLALADAFVHLAKYKEARAALTRAQEGASEDLEHFVYVQWGHLYNESCELKKAERWYRRAVQTRPGTSNLIFLGAVFAKRGEFAKAKRCYRRAARLATNSPEEAYFNLGLILRAEGWYEEALKCFNKAIAVDGKYEAAKLGRADILQAIKMKSEAKIKRSHSSRRDRVV